MPIWDSHVGAIKYSYHVLFKLVFPFDDFHRLSSRDFPAPAHMLTSRIASNLTFLYRHVTFDYGNVGRCEKEDSTVLVIGLPSITNEMNTIEGLTCIASPFQRERK